LLFSLSLLLHESRNELDDFILLTTRQAGDFIKKPPDFACRSGFRLARLSA
jgi:hypothetical protein